MSSPDSYWVPFTREEILVACARIRSREIRDIRFPDEREFVCINQQTVHLYDKKPPMTEKPPASPDTTTDSDDTAPSPHPPGS